jgi:hypothetical protein
MRTEEQKQAEKTMQDQSKQLIEDIITYYLVNELGSCHSPDASRNIVDLGIIADRLRTYKIVLQPVQICEFLNKLMFGKDKVAEFKFTAHEISGSVFFYKVNLLKK